MAGILHTLMGLLLLPYIKTGVNGEDSLILAGRGYDISFPCVGVLDSICFVIWQFSTREKSDYVAVVSNGAIQTVKSQAERLRVGSKCALHIRNLTTEDVGRYRCQQRRNVLSLLNSPSSTPESHFTPGQTVSLHCILLTYEERGHCLTQRGRSVQLKWVDEAGAKIQEDSRHQIKHHSHCDITLIVTIQREDNRKFRCRATVGQEVKTSVGFPVVPVRNGKGRGILIESDPEHKGGNQEVIGVAVGVVGCVVLTAVVALFVVNRRRMNSQLPDDPGYSTNADDDMSADDVTYAEINLPTGSERVRDRQCQLTEYASVRTAA